MSAVGPGHDPPENIGHRDQKPVLRPGVGEFLHLVVDAEDRGDQQQTRRLAAAVGFGEIPIECLVVARRVGDVAACHGALPLLANCGALAVLGQTDTGERPALMGIEEITVGDADMPGRGRATPAAKHHLVRHELAVVFADRAR